MKSDLSPVPQLSARDCSALLLSACGAFIIVFAYYLLFLPNSVFWLDSPEFMTASVGLGLPHPPGHPAAVMLMKLFSLFPAGAVAFRTNLFSAFWGAVCAALVTLISFLISFRMGSVVRAVLAGIFSGLLFALCRSMVIQSMAAEVYTLNGALVLCSFAVVLAGPANGLRPDDARTGAVAGTLLGLAFANHHYLALLAMPSIVVLFFRGRESVRPLFVAIGATVVTALCSYMYLPVRSAAGAWPFWASVNDLSSFFWYVSASVFSQSFGPIEEAVPVAGDIGNGALALVLIGRSLTPAVPVMALGGLYLTARSGHVRQAFALVLLIVGGMASKMAMGILDPSNPDDHGYFMTALAGFAVSAPMLIVSLTGILCRGRRSYVIASAISTPLMLGILVWVALGGVEIACQRAVFDDTTRVADIVFDSVPQDGVAMISHYPVFFVAQYARQVEGRRPDMTLVQQSLYYKARGGIDYAGALAVRDPDLEPLATGFSRTGSIFWLAVTALAGTRPVMIEASPDLKIPLSDVGYDGWLFRVGGDGCQTADPGVFVDTLRRDLFVAARHSTETRRVLVRNLTAGAGWLEHSGDNDGAAVLLKGALELNPDDCIVRGRLKRVNRKAGDGK